MELPPPPPLENGDANPVNPEPESTSVPSDTQWYDIEYARHRSYLDRWSKGAVTEGSLVRSPFGYLTNGKRFVSDETSSKWTDAEKLAFFGALARRSRWQPDLIALDIGGSKTQAEVVQYIEVLERERRILKVFSRPRKTHLRSQGWISGLAPAARQIKDTRIEWEESMAERLQSRDIEIESQALVKTAREEQLRSLEEVASAHRKEATDMEKSLDKDFEGMRPRRLEILNRAKSALDAAVETAKSDHAAKIVEKVLRTCDGNGLKVLDVLVRQTAEGAVRHATTQLHIPDAQPLDTATPSVEAQPAILPPPPPTCLPSEPSTRTRSTINLEREKQETERYAYLSRFPVRQLDERHKAEKQMLAKRIRMRQKRREGRGVVGGIPGNNDNAGNAESDAGVGEPSTGGHTLAPAAADATVSGSAGVSAPVGGARVDHNSTGGNVASTDATAASNVQAGNANVSGPPAEEPNASNSQANDTNVNNAQAVDTHVSNAQEDDSSVSKTALGVSSAALSTSDTPGSSATPLDLHSHRTHRPDTLEKHASKIEQEQYEKARSEYLSRIPLVELTDEQKQEKRTLTERVRARERYRAKVAAKMGIKVEQEAMKVVDAPTADIRLLVLHERKRKRGKGAENPDGNDSAGTETEDGRQAKRRQRFKDEQDQYERLLRLSRLKTAMSAEDRQNMIKLGSRIRSREWARAKALKVLTGDLGRNESSEGMSHQDTKDAEEVKVKGKSGRRKVKVGEPQRSEESLQHGTKTPIEPVPFEPVSTELPSGAAKKKLGRPRKLKREEVVQEPQPLAPNANAGTDTDQRSRRRNQYTEDGIGKTRFWQDLKSHYESNVIVLTSFLDECDTDFEDEFRLFLRTDAKVAAETLYHFRYAPQLHAFVNSRRLDLLDLSSLASVLSRAKDEQEYRTVDITQVLASFGPIKDLIRQTLRLCIELTEQAQGSGSETTAIDQDTIVLGLSFLDHSLLNGFNQRKSENDSSGSEDNASLAPRISDAEWVEMVDPSDGLFEEDPLAEDDADAEMEDERLLAVEEQQDILDRFEDEEYEERIGTAILHPDAVVMGDSALPMLEHDAFDWTMYETGKDNPWRKAQSKVRQETLPRTWTHEPSEAPAVTRSTSAQLLATEEIKKLRDRLRQTIYHHNRLGWQRIKRLRDPMYHLGGVKRLPSAYKSAEYIDTSDNTGSETEVEEEDELMDFDDTQGDDRGGNVEDPDIEDGESPQEDGELAEE